MLGDIDEYYFLEADYHILQESVQPYRMEEPYFEIALLEEASNFISRIEPSGSVLDVPIGVSCMAVRSTGAIGCIYAGRDTYCRGVSLILRHSVCAGHLFPVVERVFGPEADAYSLIEMAGEQSLPALGEILSELKKCKYDGQAAGLYLSAKVSEALAALTDSIEHLDTRMVPRYTAYERQAVLTIQTILHKSIKKAPTLQALASQVGMNPNKMQGAFKHYTGVTVMDYLRSYRLERAMELLQGDMLLDEIAREVGYRSASRFSEVFAKAYGMLPSKYRKMIAGQYADRLSKTCSGVEISIMRK